LRAALKKKSDEYSDLEKKMKILTEENQELMDKNKRLEEIALQNDLSKPENYLKKGGS